MAFIHPNSLATGTSLAGMRAALRDEFTDIYVVNLRGDAYKSGEEFRREGEKLFGGGSRNGVQITVLVRNPEEDTTPPATLHYAEVPEYSTLEDKFEWLSDLGDVTDDRFEVVPVNDRHDWVNLTDGTFDKLLPVCSTRKAESNAVAVHASGVKTNCDVYVYSFSREALVARVKALIEIYEEARLDFINGCSLEEVTQNTSESLPAIKWTNTLKQSLKAKKEIVFKESRIREVLYRPFTKLWLYEDDRILSSVKTVSKLFPREDSLSLSLSLQRIPCLHRIELHDLRSSRHQLGMRPQRGRDVPSLPSRTQAILISGTSNMTFQALATTTLPDLASIKGSQQTRAIPRLTG